MSDIAIGIDLGTSNSCVALARGGSVEVLPNAYGEYTTASVVAFQEDGSITVGNAAKANIIHAPSRTVHSSKRLIGRYFFSEEVKKAQAVYSYDIVETENHGLRIQVVEERFSLPEIAAMILREMKSIAESRLGQPVDKAVITVPAYFNDNQRQATKDAGRIAGLEVLRILNEPTAAALSYGFGRGLSQRVAVWDLGGGTFDISVLDIGADVFEVLATAGDTFLGGDDFDDRLIDLLADEFAATEGINLRNDPFALEKLKVAAEGAKKGLSIEDEVEIRIPDVITGEDGRTRSLERRLTSIEYATLVNDLIQRTFKVCDEALQEASVIARDLDGVILVGGPTRLPLVRSAVQEYFQQDAKANVDPDQVVAMGAAIHAASLVNTNQEAYLLDVTPLSLRIGVLGGLAETVIERNTPVPIEQTRAFTTARDHQESVEIRVYQGESQEAGENELLGQFSFSDFEKGRRGDVAIDVTFEINTDGIVNVVASDRATGQQASTRITLSSGLSEGELESIIEESRTNRVETTADRAGEVLGSIPLNQVSVEAPNLTELDGAQEAAIGEQAIVPLETDGDDEIPPLETDDDDEILPLETDDDEILPLEPDDAEPVVIAETEPVLTASPEPAAVIAPEPVPAQAVAMPEVAPVTDAPAEMVTDEMEVYAEAELPGKGGDGDLTELIEHTPLPAADDEPIVELTEENEVSPAPVQGAPAELFEAPGTDLADLEGGEDDR